MRDGRKKDKKHKKTKINISSKLLDLLDCHKNKKKWLLKQIIFNQSLYKTPQITY